MRTPILAIALVVYSSLFAGGFALADAGQGSFSGHMMGDGWVMGPFMMLAFLAIVIVAVFLLVRAIGGNAANQSRSALTILEERFARGEIDAEEFEARKKTLAG